MFVLGAESEGLPGWAQVLIGIAAFVGVITKQLIPPWVLKERDNRIATLETENKELHTEVVGAFKEVTPALTLSNSAVTEALAEIRLLRRRE